MEEQAVEDADRLLRVVDRDVDVHAEDQLAARDVLELVDERAVAVAGGDALALEEAERVRAGRADAEAGLGCHLQDGAAQVPQLAVDISDVPAHRRRDLEHRLHQLRVELVLEVAAFDRGEHRVDVLDEVERSRVEKHVLLLDAERVRIARPEAMVEDARLEGGISRREHRLRSRAASAGRRASGWSRWCSPAGCRGRSPRAPLPLRRSPPPA